MMINYDCLVCNESYKSEVYQPTPVCDDCLHGRDISELPPRIEISIKAIANGQTISEEIKIVSRYEFLKNTERTSSGFKIKKVSSLKKILNKMLNQAIQNVKTYVIG